VDVETMTPEGPMVEAIWCDAERRRLERLCATITGDPSAAEDLAQQTLLEAWRIRHRLVDPSGSSAWLDAIARHVCRRWRTRRARHHRHESSAEAPEELLGPSYQARDELEDVLEREELAELLERALGLLPPETRQALVARYVEELDPTAIGRRLSLSPEAVSMRLSRGRARIRELLETDLRDEPLARLWVSRHGVAWRTIQVSCSVCGSLTSSMRRDEQAGVVETRCERCHPDGPASSWSLANPALRPHLTAVSRPSAVLGRMADWSLRWWPSAIAEGRADCTGCGRPVEVLPYERDEPGQADASTRRGWHASCGACGETLSTSLLGLTLTSREGRALRSRRPRAHAVPTRHTEHAGRPAVVVGLLDDASGDRVDALFDDATARPVRVVATA
jgi:RNA polymerase sigma factor (sigma-70 family)